MFGLGMPEILLILAIALIVIGPKKLPELAKTLGRAMGEFKRSAQDFKRSIDMETTLHDIKSSATDMTDITGKSRQEKKDNDQNQKKPDQDKPDQDKPDQDKPDQEKSDYEKSDQEKTDGPKYGPLDDAEAVPENDAPKNDSSGDKKSR